MVPSKIDKNTRQNAIQRDDNNLLLVEKTVARNACTKKEVISVNVILIISKYILETRKLEIIFLQFDLAIASYLCFLIYIWSLFCIHRLFIICLLLDFRSVNIFLLKKYVSSVSFEFLFLFTLIFTSIPFGNGKGTRTTTFLNIYLHIDRKSHEMVFFYSFCFVFV